MSHNSTNILQRGSSASSVVERVCLIDEQAKGHTRRDLKIMGEGINPTLHTWVVIKHVTVDVAEPRDILVEGGASEKGGNVGLDKGSALESPEALKMLYKEDNVTIIHVFSYRHYLTFSVCPIEMGVKIAQVGLIPLFCCGLR